MNGKGYRLRNPAIEQPAYNESDDGRDDLQELVERLIQADECGVKLEVVQDQFTWEFLPSPLHQGVVREIDRSVRPSAAGGAPGCGFYTLRDTYVRFADGSLKRPDLVIFCRKPALTRDALMEIPDAVVEVLSPGSERKDLDVGPPFYLSQGVKDVVVVNPKTGAVHHFRRDAYLRLTSPVTIPLQAGCDISC